MQEARELANDPCTDYSAGPLEVCLMYIHGSRSIFQFYGFYRMISLYVMPLFPDSKPSVAAVADFLVI